MKNPIETFEEYVSHPQLDAQDIASLYFKFAGESPGTIPGLTALLPAEVVLIVDADLTNAPVDEAGWSEFKIMIPECDQLELTHTFRLGVEAVREFRRIHTPSETRSPHDSD